MSRKQTPDIMAAMLDPTKSATTLPASKIRTDGGTQMRAQLDEETIDAYFAAMRTSGGWKPFPPAVVFYDGETHWLGDGFHRLAAFRKMNFAASPGNTPEVLVDIRSGTRQDAILHAAGANAAHGLRRTDADKRRAVEAILSGSDWSDWSDRKIAEICHVSPTFVGKVRKSITNPPVADTAGDTVHVDSIQTERTFLHPKTGKPTTMKTGNIGKPKATKPEEKPLHTLDCEAIIRRAIERSTGATDSAEIKLAWLERATTSDFYAARDAAWKEGETDPGWANRPIRHDRLTEALSRITGNLQDAARRDKERAAEQSPKPEELPAWVTDAPKTGKPTTITISIDLDTAAGIILAFDRGKMPDHIPGLDQLVDDMVLASNAARAQQATTATAAIEDPLPAWRPGWDWDVDEGEYNMLETEWSVEDITRPLVAVRLIEEEDDQDLCVALRKRYNHLTGG